MSARIHLGLLHNFGAVLHLHAAARALAFVDGMASTQAAKAGGVGGRALAGIADE